MEVQIKKWGNSASVRLPSSIMKDLSLKVDDTLDVYLEEGVLVMRPAKRGLLSLLEKISPDNLHDDYLADTATGRELL